MTLRLQEMQNSTVVGTAVATVALSSTWQLVTVTYVVKQPGQTALNYNAFVANVAGSGVAFYADDASLTLG